MPAFLEFLVGLGGLLIGGHFIVDASSKIGAKFGLTPLVIGLTIVAAGTSAPELAVVFQAIVAEDTELAVGSVIGSNIANILLVLGLATTFGTIHVTTRVVRIDIPIMIAASVAVFVMSLDGKLTRPDGIILFAGVVSFVIWTLRAASRTAPDDEGAAVLAKAPSEKPTNLLRQSIALVLGIATIAIAARYVVSGAEAIALSLGVPELIVGLTIVAIGTSAPEIVTTVIAALKGKRELAVGNAVGSNIFNLLLVLGATTTLAPNGIDIGDDAVRLDLPIMVAAAFACLPIVFWDHKLDRWEGAIFVAYYIAYVIFLVLDGTGNRASDPFAFVLTAFVMPLTALTIGIGIVRQRRSKQDRLADRAHA